jgi:hypothetical protein
VIEYSVCVLFFQTMKRKNGHQKENKHIEKGGNKEASEWERW